MPKKLISIRINDLTQRQIAELLEKFSMTQTDCVTMAIERLHQQEIGAASQYEAIYYDDDGQRQPYPKQQD